MPALYRKWRSRSFDDVVGQEHVVRTLRNAVRQGRVAHAYLFTGPRGTGKTSTARILAKAVNCLNPDDGNPCNQCEMCLASNEGRAIDVLEIDAASNTSVDNVRDLRERVAYATGEGRYKVYIVDEVHRLSGAAFDAFLKTLEEPPAHVIFVFASTEPHKVPATIASRCQRFDFRSIGADEMLSRLQYVVEQEGLAASEEALRLVCQNAGGSLRDALGLLDQVVSFAGTTIGDSEVRSALGLADAAAIRTLSDALIQGNVGAGLEELSRFSDAGGDPGQLTRQFIDYWRALLLLVSGAKSERAAVDPALQEGLAVHARSLNESDVIAVLRALAEQEFSPKFNVPRQLPFEIGFVQAALAVSHPPASTSSPVSVVEPDVQRQTERPSAPAAGPESRVDQQPPHGPTPSSGGAGLNGGISHVPDATDVEPGTPSGLNPVAGQIPDFQEAWASIVRGMKNRSPSLQAVLRSGYVMKAAEGELTIGFLYDFHREQFADVKKRRLLEEVVAEVLGAPHRVTCVKTTREEVDLVKAAHTPQPDDGFIEEVAERLRGFHARELGNGRS